LTVSAGDRLDEVVVRLDGHEVFRGECRVVSSRKVDEEHLVGISFADALISIEDVLVLRDIRALGQGRLTSLGLPARPWFVAGHETVQGPRGRAAHVPRGRPGPLTELEASLPFQVVHGEIDSPARSALTSRACSGSLCPPWYDIPRTIDVSLRSATPQDMQALKEYALRQLHPFLMQSPWMHRSMHKPLGYPGDFRVMKYVYEDSFCGATLFAKAVSLAFVGTKPAQAVRTRKNMIKEQLAARIAARQPGEVADCAVGGAGPAQEIYELLDEVQDLKGPVTIVLFDQETPGAQLRLRPAEEAGRGQVGGRGHAGLPLRHHQAVAAEPGHLPGPGPLRRDHRFGPVRYLSFAIAARLAGNLESNLRPRGSPVHRQHGAREPRPLVHGVPPGLAPDLSHAVKRCWRSVVTGTRHSTVESRRRDRPPSIRS
jgi:hypothetical protein